MADFPGRSQGLVRVYYDDVLALGALRGRLRLCKRKPQKITSVVGGIAKVIAWFATFARDAAASVRDNERFVLSDKTSAVGWC